MSTRMSKGVRSGLISLSAAAVILTSVPAAHADPDAVAKARAEVESLSMQAAAHDQEALGAQQQLEDAQARLKNREADVAAQTGRVDAMRRQVSQVALSQYQQGSVNPVTQIFLRSDVDGFMSQFATIQQVGANQNSLLQDFQSQQANLADMKRGAATDVATIDQAGKQAKQAQDNAQTKLAAARKVLDRLSAEERARLEAERQREEREAAAQAERAATAVTNDTSRAGGRSTPTAAPTSAAPSARPSASATPTRGATSKAPAPAPAPAAPVPPGSGRGATAIAFAKAQLGKPYIYGGVGPAGYDCSGLTMKAWAAAGVSLPRVSGAQASAGRRVSLGDLQPGDLVLYGSLSHVGLYVGNGVVIHAPHTGSNVRYTTLSGFSFGVRVG
ncbi:C40 family peptidase [Mariniluteicoccus flavus]